MYIFCKVRDLNPGPAPPAGRELSINLPISQHRDFSRILFPIQECIFHICWIQGKMRSTVWTVESFGHKLKEWWSQERQGAGQACYCHIGGINEMAEVFCCHFFRVHQLLPPSPTVIMINVTQIRRQPKILGPLSLTRIASGESIMGISLRLKCEKNAKPQHLL
jgi:hypothetical protein